MKRRDFARKLCIMMEPRIQEICEKFRTGNYNDASLYVFFMGLESSIESFLEDKKLWIRKANKVRKIKW